MHTSPSKTACVSDCTDESLPEGSKADGGKFCLRLQHNAFFPTQSFFFCTVSSQTKLDAHLHAQVSYFLEGLCSMSDWDSWHDKCSEETARDSKNMLRPLMVDDFSRHLAGKLAPLNVAEWRAATTIRTSFACPGAYQVSISLAMTLTMHNTWMRSTCCSCSTCLNATSRAASHAASRAASRGASRAASHAASQAAVRCGQWTV